MISRRSILAAALGLSAGPVAAQSAPFPTRMMRIVVPFAAGGAVDAIARLLAERIQAKTGFSAIVDNRPGGSGTIGGTVVKQSDPDGHTVLFSASTHIMSGHVMARPPYDPVADFMPVGRIGTAPMLIIVAPGLPQTTLAEIAAAAKADPNKWTAATAALGSPGHMVAIAFNHLSGARLTIAPYRGTAPALNDVAGGHVQFLSDAMVALLPMARAGKVKAIAVASPERARAAPEIASASESGLPGLDIQSWYGVWAPPRTPPDLVARLDALFAEAAAELDRAGRFNELGIEPVSETPAAFAAHIRAEVDRNATLLRAANFQPE